MTPPPYSDVTQGLPVNPVLLADGGTGIVLREDIEYRIEGHTFVVPKGFVSDGCSMPRLFWRSMGHPFDMAYLREAILHDWLYRTQPVSRATADAIFFELLAGKIGWLRRRLIYRGLRIGGGVAWKQNQKKCEAANG